MSDLIERLKKGTKHQVWVMVDETADEIERLTAELHASKEGIKAYYKHRCKLEARIKVLEDVLILRGEHGEACTSRDLSDRGISFVRHDWPCDCGLREAIAAADQE